MLRIKCWSKGLNSSTSRALCFVIRGEKILNGHVNLYQVWMSKLPVNSVFEWPREELVSHAGKLEILLKTGWNLAGWVTRQSVRLINISPFVRGKQRPNATGILKAKDQNSLIIGFFCTTIYFERQLFPEWIASTVHWGGRPLIKPSEWLRH